MSKPTKISDAPGRPDGDSFKRTGLLGAFERMRAVLRSPSRPAADLRRALGEAWEVAGRAAEEQAALAGQRSAMLLATDADRAKWKADLAEAAERLADALALEDAIKTHLAAADAAEEQDRRRTAYAEAKKASMAYAGRFERDYLVAATMLLGLLREGARIAMVVEQANQALPEGAAALVHPEVLARTTEGVPERVLDERVVDLWARIDNLARPLDDVFQKGVQSMGKGWGKLRNDLQPTLRKATYRRTTTRDAVYPQFPGFLAGTLQLPAFRGTGAVGSMLWGLSPWLSDPAGVLAGIANAETVLQPAPEQTVGATRVTFEMIRADLPDEPKLTSHDPEPSRLVQSEYMAREATFSSLSGKR